MGETKSQRDKKRMSDRTILNTRRLPARLDSFATAAFLGISVHSLSVLAKRRLLVPLGGKTLAPNAPRYYASCELEELARDKDWLNRVCIALGDYSRHKNQRRGNIQKENADILE